VPRDPSEVSTLSGWVSPRAGYQPVLTRGPIRPITGRPSLFPTSSTRCTIPFPCGQDTTSRWGTTGLPSWLLWRCAPVRLGSVSRWGLRVLLPVAPYRQSAPRCHFGYGLSASLAASDW